MIIYVITKTGERQYGRLEMRRNMIYFIRDVDVKDSQTSFSVDLSVLNDISAARVWLFYKRKPSGLKMAYAVNADKAREMPRVKKNGIWQIVIPTWECQLQGVLKEEEEQ